MKRRAEKEPMENVSTGSQNVLILKVDEIFAILRLTAILKMSAILSSSSYIDVKGFAILDICGILMKVHDLSIDFLLVTGF